MNQTLGHTDMDIHKRKLDGSPSELEKAKRPRYNWYVRLESESSVASEEDTESIYSLQGKETDVVQDTPDTDTKSESGSSVGSGFEVELEFEVASLSESEDKLLENYSSSDSDILCATEDTLAAVLCDSSLERWASDREDSDTSDFEEFGRTDFQTCALCKSKNNNPLYRLCDKCFQEKKTFYPPRPRRQRKKRNAVANGVSIAKLQSCLSGLSQDSGLGSSQELGINFEQIQVPPQKDSKRANSVATTSSQGPSSQDTISEFSGVDEHYSNVSEDEKSSPTIDFLIDVDELQSTQKSSSCDATQGVTKDFSIEDIKNKNSDKTLEEPNTCETEKNAVIEDIKVDGSNEIVNIKTEDLKSFMVSPPDIVLSESKLCIVCNNKERDSAFLHGKCGHVCCCYQCAMRTWRTCKRCAYCNRKVHNVVKLYMA